MDLAFVGVCLGSSSILRLSSGPRDRTLVFSMVIFSRKAFFYCGFTSTDCSEEVQSEESLLVSGIKKLCCNSKSVIHFLELAPSVRLPSLPNHCVRSGGRFRCRGDGTCFCRRGVRSRQVSRSLIVEIFRRCSIHSLFVSDHTRWCGVVRKSSEVDAPHSHWSISSPFTCQDCWAAFLSMMHLRGWSSNHLFMRDRQFPPPII